jgi:hypothetical protein
MAVTGTKGFKEVPFLGDPEAIVPAVAVAVVVAAAGQ